MMHLVYEEMRDAILVERIDKLKRGMVGEPQMVEREIEDILRKAEPLLHALPQNRRLPRPLSPFQANEAVAPINF